MFSLIINVSRLEYLEASPMSVIIGTKVCTILATLLKSNICRKKKMWVFNFANRDINVISWVKNLKILR